MGGYGVVNSIGGGYSEASVTGQTAPPNRLLADRAASNAAYRSSIDPRIKAAIAIAPWGMQGGFWDAEGLKGITTPCSSWPEASDEIAGYEKGTKAIYTGAVNADRYLLTFINAGHNAAAPYPAPLEVMPTRRDARVLRSPDVPVRTLCRCRLGHDAHEQHPAALRHGVLRPAPERRKREAGVPRPRPERQGWTWKGFKRGTAVGLVLEHAASMR